jgi:TctA family transporter
LLIDKSCSRKFETFLQPVPNTFDRITAKDTNCILELVSYIYEKVINFITISYVIQRYSCNIPTKSFTLVILHTKGNDHMVSGVATFIYAHISCHKLIWRKIMHASESGVLLCVLLTFRFPMSCRSNSEANSSADGREGS